MCTLTWLANEKGYEVFFNRDEKRIRPKAKLPVLNRYTGTIMPIDPQGNGSWISVNSAGITLCLLNNYQVEKKVNQVNYRSRGQLINLLALNNHLSQLLSQLKHFNLTTFMPFWLFIFPSEFKKNNEYLYQYQWNGKVLTQEEPKQPFITSAIQLTEVNRKRTTLYNDMIQLNPNTEQHLAYHSSHIPVKGKYSVCMHRHDACTHSLSHIVVGDDIVFRYHDSPPCKNTYWSMVCMQKENQT